MQLRHRVIDLVCYIGLHNEKCSCITHPVLVGSGRQQPKVGISRFVAAYGLFQGDVRRVVFSGMR